MRLWERMRSGTLRVLVTGGAGFLGTNLAFELVERGYYVVLLDNLTGQASKENVRLLSEKDQVVILEGDVRDKNSLDQVPTVDVIVHAAANVNWKRALVEPFYDFSVNALGTLNVLEWARSRSMPLLYISTCKVYSDTVNALPIQELNSRFTLLDRPDGIDESLPVQVSNGTRGVYGCSKLVGELYCHELGRLFGLPVIIDRLSSIYGPYQHGTEGYGWATWFIRAIKDGIPIKIFGSGKQVRDLLHITDLTRLIALQIHDIEKRAGEIYNVGGGPVNSLSLLEYINLVEAVEARKACVEFQAPRPSDFLVYVSDIRKVSEHFGWTPRLSVREEIRKLWLTI